MRTSEVAQRAGVNVQTLRYYERRGLLPEPPRSSAGYRAYPTDAIRVVRFVKRAQELGFSLNEVEELLHLAGGDPQHSTWHWHPATTTVLAARTTDRRPSSCCTCPHINFHTRNAHAHSYLAAHPDLTGRLLDQHGAVDLAHHAFALLLRTGDQDGLSTDTDGGSAK